MLGVRSTGTPLKPFSPVTSIARLARVQVKAVHDDVKYTELLQVRPPKVVVLLRCT